MARKARDDWFGPPPDKYLDGLETELNPAWLEWMEDATTEAALATGQDPATYYPESYGKGIPDEGAWIIVIDVPHTALAFDVPVMSIWRARRHECNYGRLQLGHRSKAPMSRGPQQAVIATPGGDLHLWPHEYVVCGDVTPFIGEPGCEMHTLGGDPVLADDDDRLFYVMSRGIDRHEAALLLLNDVTNLDFVYFTFDDDIVETFRGVGLPLWRHIALHPRADDKPFEVSITVDGEPIEPNPSKEPV